jgi:hypothetical protein
LRPCTFFVTEPNGQRLRYCKPNALCDSCLAKIGGLAKLHADCRQGAHDTQAQNDAMAARLDTGELFIASALSGRSWHVPAGQVGAEFAGRGKAHVWLLVPQEDYRREHNAKGQALAASDFPGAPVWEDDPDVRKAREAGTEQVYVVGPISVNPHQFERFEVTALADEFGKVRRIAEQRLGHEHFWIVRKDTLTQVK